MQTIQHISFQTLFGKETAFESVSSEERKKIGKMIFQKLDSKNAGHFIAVEEKNEKGFFVLYGLSKRPVRYVQKMLGKQFLQTCSDRLKQCDWGKKCDIHHQIFTACKGIGQLVLENADLHALYTEINTRVKDIAGCRNAGLFLYDEKSKYLVLKEPAFDLQMRKNDLCYSYSLAENSIVVNVFKNRVCIYNNDASADPAVLGCLSTLLRIENIMAVPLLIGNLCIGVYCLLNRYGGFNSEMELTIRQMMSQIAVSIISAQQLTQLRQNEEELKRICRQEKENSSRYKYLMDAHLKLTTILIQEPELEVIVNRIARHFKMPVVIFDYLHWRYITSDVEKEKKDAVKLNHLADYFKRLSQDPKMCSAKPFREIFFLNGAEETAVVAALKVKDDIMGFIVVLEDTKKLTQLQLLALDRTVHMCTLEFLKQKMAFEVEQNLKNDFLDALISWNENKEIDVVNMAANCGYDFSRPYLVAVFNITGRRSPGEEQSFFQEKKRVLRVLNGILKKNPGGMVFCKGDNIIVLTPHPGNLDEALSKGHQEEHRYFSQIQRSVLDAAGISVSIGIGSVVKDLKDIKQSYFEACAAVDFLQQSSRQGVILFQELGFYQLFADQKERKRLEEIAKGQLKELISSDCSKGTSFLKTLERYFYNDGNLRATSEDLHIHINTLRYRLKVLKDSFNIDLTAEKCKFNTYFAVKTLYFLCPKLFSTG